MVRSWKEGRTKYLSSYLSEQQHLQHPYSHPMQLVSNEQNTTLVKFFFFTLNLFLDKV